jgi:argininosuccinate lyase
MEAAVTPECFATDRAIELTASGVPFREAYRRIASDPQGSGPMDATASIRARVSPGAPGDLRLEEIEKRLNEA